MTTNEIYYPIFIPEFYSRLNDFIDAELSPIFSTSLAATQAIFIFLIIILCLKVFKLAARHHDEKRQEEKRKSLWNILPVIYLAKVIVKLPGVVWKELFRVNVTSRLKPGANTLTVKVNKRNNKHQ